jgi:hypothetical protein
MRVAKTDSIRHLVLQAVLENGRSSTVAEVLAKVGHAIDTPTAVRRGKHYKRQQHRVRRGRPVEEASLERLAWHGRRAFVNSALIQLYKHGEIHRVSKGVYAAKKTNTRSELRSEIRQRLFQLIVDLNREVSIGEMVSLVACDIPAPQAVQRGKVLLNASLKYGAIKNPKLMRTIDSLARIGRASIINQAMLDLARRGLLSRIRRGVYAPDNRGGK